MPKEIPKEIPPELYEVYDEPARAMRFLPQRWTRERLAEITGQ
jgi:hypothetical protein